MVNGLNKCVAVINFYHTQIWLRDFLSKKLVWYLMLEGNIVCFLALVYLSIKPTDRITERINYREQCSSKCEIYAVDGIRLELRNLTYIPSSCDSFSDVHKWVRSVSICLLVTLYFSWLRFRWSRKLQETECRGNKKEEVF